MRALWTAVFTATALFGSLAHAAERTVILAVDNMYCAACPHIVSTSLYRIDGVAVVAISNADKTATVTFDDARASVADLIKATTDAGYPSKVRP
ncbi:MAG: cation transporter [Alphaproteobacteria bacterium]|nr:cation transporter [Alphaproteobacteria bacterium]MCB9931490.1 cation transporter [Alphaproteobacteria bacterium]